MPTVKRTAIVRRPCQATGKIAGTKARMSVKGIHTNRIKIAINAGKSAHQSSRLKDIELFILLEIPSLRI
jgi:hypothetical protein